MNRLFGLVVILMGFSLVGCNPAKKTTQENRVVGNKKVSYILEQVQNNESSYPKYLSFKANSELVTPEKTVSFKISVRMATDSAIWMSITGYGVEVIRVLATPDSLKYFNRQDKKFYIGNYSFISDKMGVGFTFYDLQSLVLGHSFGLDNLDKINKTNSKSGYVLSSVNKGKLKRYTKGKLDIPEDVEVVFSNWINPDTYQVEKVSMLDLETQNQASIQYLTFENLSQYTLLSSFKMDIIADKKLVVNSKFSKFQVDKPLRFPFKISSKYEQIK